MSPGNVASMVIGLLLGAALAFAAVKLSYMPPEFLPYRAPVVTPAVVKHAIPRCPRPVQPRVVAPVQR